MENLGMLYVHFKEEPLISSIRTETYLVEDSNIAKEALKSKQIEMGSQIRQQGPLLSALLFKAFPYFQCFRNLANAANSCKTLLDKFL